MSRHIDVHYVATEACADPAALAAWIRQELEHYIHTQCEFDVHTYDLQMEVKSFESTTNQSSVTIGWQGKINDASMEEVFSRTCRRPSLAGFSSYMVNRSEKWRREHSPISVIVDRLADWGSRQVRNIRPSPLMTVIGRPATFRRDVQALSQCIAEIQLAIDRATNRHRSISAKTYRIGTWLAILAAVIGALSSVVFMAYSPGTPAESSGEDGAFMAIALGFPTFIYAGMLCLLSEKFYLGDPAGRRLLKSLGLRSVSALRFIAVALCSLSLVAIAFGVYKLL